MALLLGRPSPYQALVDRLLNRYSPISDPNALHSCEATLRILSPSNDQHP